MAWISVQGKRRPRPPSSTCRAVPSRGAHDQVVREGGPGRPHAERTGRDTAEDYLRVYHAYFNERAYEEAYGMLDSASAQEVTLGDWLSFYAPLWGERYISVDTLDPLSSGTEEAA
jgi:hypothetical protein